MAIKNKSHSGIAAIGLLLFFLLFLGVLIGLDYGYVYYNENCADESPIDCFFKGGNKALTAKLQEKNTVSAKGSFSYKNYGADITINIPLDGGSITGSFSGVCSGKITGTYAAGESGAVTGRAVGSCTPLVVPLPAHATFTGTVLQQQHSVPISGTGSVVGISGSGSLTLKY